MNDDEDGDMFHVTKPTERMKSRQTRMTELKGSLLPLFFANA
jgi:hypothetical protein